MSIRFNQILNSLETRMYAFCDILNIIDYILLRFCLHCSLTVTLYFIYLKAFAAITWQSYPSWDK